MEYFISSISFYLSSISFYRICHPYHVLVLFFHWKISQCFFSHLTVILLSSFSQSPLLHGLVLMCFRVPSGESCDPHDSCFLCFYVEFWISGGSLITVHSGEVFIYFFSFLVEAFIPGNVPLGLGRVSKITLDF